MQIRLERLLESQHFSAVCVSSAAAAIEAISAVFFPMVILDRMLDDGDGLRLCAEVRQRSLNSRVYILMLSVLDSETEIRKGLAAGADVYLSKATSEAELIARFREARTVARLPKKQATGPA